MSFTRTNSGVLVGPKVFDKVAMRRRVCMESYYDFVQEFWYELVPDPPIWNWHVRILCNALQKQLERTFRMQPKEYDIVCNVPPGTSKSTIFSIMLLPWCWTRKPNFRMINATYGADLSLDFGNKARHIVKSDLFKETFPNIVIAEDQDAKGYFCNTMLGERIATSTGANITGKHAHYIGLDDLINPQGVRSSLIRETTNDWFTLTIPSRCVNLSITPINLIQQRLAVDDPAGSRLARAELGGIPVKLFRFPAELSDLVHPPIFKNKYRNGLLDPIRLPQAILNDKKGELGQFGYAGQYEQSPLPSTGGMFQTDKFVIGTPPPPAAFSQVIRWWDKAATGAGGDHTAGVLMGITKDMHAIPRFWVLDVFHEQVDSDTRERLIKQHANTDCVFYKNIYKVGIEQEPGSAGIDSAKATVRNLIGFAVIVEKATGSKVDRADPYSTQVNAGNVGLAKGRWNKVYIDQLKFFDEDSTKDDLVDASSGGFKQLYKKKSKAGAGGF